MRWWQVKANMLQPKERTTTGADVAFACGDEFAQRNETFRADRGCLAVAYGLTAKTSNPQWHCERSKVGG